MLPPELRVPFGIGRLHGVGVLDIVAGAADDPVHGGVFVDVDVQGQGGGGLVGDGGRFVLELRRRAVHGRERQLLHGGAARAVRVDEAEIGVVGLQLIQTVKIDVVDVVFDRVLRAALERSAQRADAELLRCGRGAALIVKHVVEGAVLVGHGADLNVIVDHRLAILRFDALVLVALIFPLVLRNNGVARVEGGGGIVRRDEGDDLDRALPAAGVGHHGGEVVIAVGRQVGDGGGDLRVGGGDGEIAVGKPRHVALRIALGGRDQLLLGDGAVHRGADRPIDRAGLVGGVDARGVGGRDVPELGIARQQTRIGGGFLRLRRVHSLSGDAGGQARADRDVVGQHLHGGARGVDKELVDVADAGDVRGGVEVEGRRRAVDVEVERGISRLLIDGEGVHRAHGDVQQGTRCLVDDVFQIAGEREARRYVGGFQRDVQQTVARTGAILHKGVGAQQRVGDLGVALGAQRDVLVGDAVHQQGVRLHVAQDDALAALTLAAAGDDDVAEDADVVQRDVAEVEAAGDVEVAGDGGVLEGRARRADGHVAVGVGERVGAGRVDERAQRALEHDAHLAAGDVVLRLVGAVAVTADEAHLRGGAGVAAAPVGEIAAVGKLRDLAGNGVKTHVARQQHHRLLTGERRVRRGHARRDAAEVVGVVRDADVVVEPCGIRHVDERRGAGLRVAVGAVDHGDELGARQRALRMQAAVGIAADDAPVEQLIHRGLAHGVGGADQLRA